jgi:hypothetical protein
MSDPIGFIRDWFDLNPYVAPALAFWLLSAVVCHCLMLVRNSFERRITDRGAIWLRRASRILLITSTILLAMSFMPESVIQTMAANYYTLARETGFEANYPVRWKTDTGDLATVRIRGKRIRIEVKNPGSGPRGSFNQAEIEKQQGAYAGIAKASHPCVSGKRSAIAPVPLCTQEAPIALTLITPRRIEGRIGAFESVSGVRSNRQTTWRQFVWTPQ